MELRNLCLQPLEASWSPRDGASVLPEDFQGGGETRSWPRAGVSYTHLALGALAPWWTQSPLLTLSSQLCPGEGPGDPLPFLTRAGVRQQLPQGPPSTCWILDYLCAGLFTAHQTQDW